MTPAERAVDLLWHLITPEPLPVLRRCVLGHIQCSVSHADLVSGYREERQRQELFREEETAGYEAEIAAYPPLITFRDWLEGSRRHV